MQVCCVNFQLILVMSFAYMPVLIVLKLYYRPCSNLSCRTNLQYDGRDSGILFMGKFAILYDIIRDYVSLPRGKVRSSQLFILGCISVQLVHFYCLITHLLISIQCTVCFVECGQSPLLRTKKIEERNNQTKSVRIFTSNRRTQTSLQHPTLNPI